MNLTLERLLTWLDQHNGRIRFEPAPGLPGTRRCTITADCSGERKQIAFTLNETFVRERASLEWQFERAWEMIVRACEVGPDHTIRIQETR